MLTRKRSTWNKGASEAPAVPREEGGHPASKPDPKEHDYENGDTSSWAEDPMKGPYTQSAHPAYPDEGLTHPAAKKARLTPKQAALMQKKAEIKAAKCVKMASAFLGADADEQEVEDQALAFMSMPEDKIKASLDRLAEDEVEPEVEAEPVVEDDEEALLAAMLAEEEEEAAPEPEPEPEATAKTAALERRLARAERALRKLAEEKEEKEPEPEPKEDAKTAALRKRLAKVEALLARHASEEEEKEEKTAGQNEPDFFYTGKGKKAADEDLDEEEKAMLAEMIEEDEKATEKKAADEDEDLDEETAAMLAEMLAEEEGDAAPEAPEAEEPAEEEAVPEEEGKEACEACEGVADDADGAFFEDGTTAGDPMGMYGADEVLTDEDDALLASLYQSAEIEAEEEAEPKVEKTARAKTARVAPKPVAKKASAGARKLGNVRRTASVGVPSLENIWESAPDVSDVYNQ